MNLRRAALLLASLMIMCSSSLAQNTNSLGLNTIVIDPGHGGKDAGAVSQDKRTLEKNLTLSISRKLADKIRAEYPEMKVILTRDKDVFVALKDRAQLATKNNANLFISVHINAATNRSANGFSAYILGQSSNRNSDTYAFNMEVMRRENSVIYLEDNAAAYGNLDDDSPEAQIMSQFMFNAFREQSLSFAETVNNGMKTPFKKSLGVHQANFQVLREASMPAVLLELGFISNASDLTVLRADKEIDRLVDNLFKSFCKYKTSYDASVSIGPAAGVQKDIPQEPEVKPEPVKAEPAKTETVKPEPVKAGIPETGEGLSPDSDPQDIELPDEFKAAARSQSVPSAFYGVQILATSRHMEPTDPFFKGYEVTAVQSGNLTKYIIGVFEDVDEAAEGFKKIRADFKDSFLVRIEDGRTYPVR